MANEPKVLNVNNYQTTTEKVSGGQGTSSATVSSAPKELQKSEQSQVGVDLTNVKGTATGNTEERSLKVSKDATVGSYVRDTNRAGNPGRTKRNIVNTVTVEDVKALIKKYGGGDSYSKEQIDEMLATIREGQYVKVDTTTYPTLEDFLASEGEQGTVYLYPVGNEENNYYQYIWEVSEWVSLGTTVLDLSGYPTLTGNNTFSGDNEFTKPIKASNVFNVINASDIVNNTLTQAQYDLITNGKPTLIKGTFLGITDLLLVKQSHSSGGGGIDRILGIYPETYGVIKESLFNISSSFVISKYIDLLEFNANKINISNIGSINSKTFPAYPSNTGTYVMKCIEGVLTWVQE